MMNGWTNRPKTSGRQALKPEPNINAHVTNSTTPLRVSLEGTAVERPSDFAGTGCAGANGIVTPCAMPCRLRALLCMFKLGHSSPRCRELCTDGVQQESAIESTALCRPTRRPDGVNGVTSKMPPARPGGQNVPSTLTSPANRKGTLAAGHRACGGSKNASCATHFPLSFHRFALSRWRAYAHCAIRSPSGPNRSKIDKIRALRLCRTLSG